MASSDDCTQSWKLDLACRDCANYDTYGCNYKAILAPSNGITVNLLLLMADIHAERYKVALTAAQPPERQDSPLFTWNTLVARFSAPTDASASGRDDSLNNDDNGLNTFDSVDGFPNAVKANSSLTPEERDALLAARLAQNRESSRKTTGEAEKEAFANVAKTVMTPAGKAFADYLTGASFFWLSDYQRAADSFAALIHADTPWIKETSLYMLGRIAVNRLQEGSFDAYGNIDRNRKPEPKLVAEAQTALDNYLREYPNGLYALSARGLKRRGYWLGGGREQLAKEYGALLILDPKDRNVNDFELVQEIGSKLISALYEPGSNRSPWELLSTSPTLLAVFDLQRMRGPEAQSAITRAELEAQKESFVSDMPLYEYLLAFHVFYVENQPAEVLRLIPEATQQSSFSYLEFSRQMLRGMALEAEKDRAALDFWMRMLPGASMPFQRSVLELAVALRYEHAGMVSKVFAADSPVRYPYLRQVLLLNVADVALLRRQAKDKNASQRERDKALFTLLYKEATRGHAADFLKDVSLVANDAPASADRWYFMVPDDGGVFRWRAEEPIPLGLFRQPIGGAYDCPSMVGVQTRLAKKPNDPKGLLCLADFVRINSWVTRLDTPPSEDQLGGSRSQFPGKPYARMPAYQSVLKNPKSSTDNKAYALYRMVNCYAPSGYSDCGGEDVPLAQRRAWSVRLKENYPSSRWAKELKYYW